jgi:omega-amidase
MKNKISIALVQTNLYWEDVTSNLDNFSKIIKSIKQKVDIIILPEMFNSGFSMNAKKTSESMSGKSIKWLKETSKHFSSAIISSLAIKENDKYYNRLIWTDPNGDIEYYDKRHTFTLSGESDVFSKGEKNNIIEYEGWKFLPQICYDLRFPVWSRNTTGFDAIVYIANWPDKRINHWDTLLKARAIENLSYTIGVNITGDDPFNKYVGHSSVYDPMGQQVTHLTESSETIIVELDKEFVSNTRKNLDFLSDQDKFFIHE